FICPDPNNFDKAYHILINAGGAVMDGLQTSAATIDKTWQSQARIDVVKEANRWIVNVALPFASIGVNDVNFTGDMVVNFYRTRVAGGQPTPFVWSPTGEAAYFVPGKFGRMTFVKAE
ncbi:MAG: hypothetical protein IKP87_03025, partial [Victivallales bacterium]|nr:hypothetical protein [Victivallales bacterium]